MSTYLRCYRRLPEIKAISFDLDDTLYDNLPVLQQAEQAQQAFIQRQIPEARATDIQFWADIRRQLAKSHPGLCHNLTALRQQGLLLGLRQLGLTEANAQSLSGQAFAVFYAQRNQIGIPAAVMATLKKLADHYPLIALTNGNADFSRIGLSPLFQFAINAGDDEIKSKPDPGMFSAACLRLNIEPQQLLHVGDSLKSDIQGALNAGCSAVWFNPNKQRLTSQGNLPHLEIREIKALAALLPL